MPKIDDDLQQALKSIVDGFDLEERPVRERQIRLWKKLEYYWAGFTRIWWDDVAHDWRIFDDGYGYETNGMGYYDKSVNVFRAYLESIIAALSSTVPTIKAFPDDADNTLDITTARGATKIADLIYKHNDASLLWVRALFVYCTQGMIAAYNHTVESDKYGTADVDEYEDVEQELPVNYCPVCKANLTTADVEAGMSSGFTELDEFDPTDHDAKLHYLLRDVDDPNKVVCPTCQASVDPEIKTEAFTVTRLVGRTAKPKSRQKIEVYGGLFVKVPNWARNQGEIPYLGYSYETHYVNVLHDYPDIREDLISKEGKINSGGGNELYERWGRLSPQYYGEYPINTPTVRHYWLRPCAFNAVRDDDIRKELERKFPDGCRVTWINECFAEAVNESLDDHWTITRNPLSEYIHFDPLGLLITSIQEITQDLVSLTVQTIEHGIPQVFADPSVLNFDAYSNTEAIPGGIYPARPKSGKSVSDAFYMVSTATLSQQVQPFSEQVQSLGQFISGAMPSIWGGSEAGGSSRTAAQASMSRNQSLQRLQTTWKMINVWWKEIFGKVIPAYMKSMLDDERIVKEVHGTYINDVISMAELEGKLGEIELESSDQLPATFGQIRDTIMQLINTNNQEIMSILGAPNNIGIIQEYLLGDAGLVADGEDDREKQYEEITQLLKSSPISDVDPQTGQPTEKPSIEPDFEVDNHKIEADICRMWAVSESGRTAKVNNPNGYKNVLLHMKEHINYLQQLQVPQGGQQPPPQGPKLKPVNNNG